MVLVLKGADVLQFGVMYDKAECREFWGSRVGVRAWRRIWARPRVTEQRKVAQRVAGGLVVTKY